MRLIIRSDIGKTSIKYRNLARLLPATYKAALLDLGNDALILYEKTTATWTHDVQFQVVPTPRGVSVQTDDEIYKFVDFGTRAHVIEARRAPVLRFRGPYHAKTIVNYIASYQGGRGNQWTSKRKVQHPGTRARNFSKLIKEHIQGLAANRIKRALSDAAAGSGFGL